MEIIGLCGKGEVVSFHQLPRPDERAAIQAVDRPNVVLWPFKTDEGERRLLVRLDIEAAHECLPTGANLAIIESILQSRLETEHIIEIIRQLHGVRRPVASVPPL